MPPTATVAVASGALPEAPAAAAPPPPPAPAPVAAAPAPAKAATPPDGPFFELAQVDRPPQVASRVEPHLPADLAITKEIVIARVLVSQAGHPVLVRLLRPSKSGPGLDAAVIAAVQQWTFSPAHSAAGGELLASHRHHHRSLSQPHRGRGGVQGPALCRPFAFPHLPVESRSQPAL